ncbi:MAG: hypothetical protein V3V25_07635 [Paracoccaceae bacterium]
MFIELNRQFISLSEEDISSDEIEARFDYGLGTTSSWEDVLKEFRVVVLAAAGTGKTKEIENSCTKLREDGKPAFFLRLESLATEWDAAFEIGSHTELEAINARQKECWVFLDSIDEARLSGPKDFEKAIRRLRSNMDGNLQNAHIILTSRVEAWRPKQDQIMVEKHLPFAQSRTLTQVEADTADDVFEDIQVKSRKNETSSLAFYTLRGLTTEQITTYSTAHGVLDTARFLKELEKNDVQNLARRPKDLDDLLQFWKAYGCLGSRLELFEDNISRKLSETDPDRAGKDPLTVEKTELGALRLAAAVSTTRLTRIIVPDSENPNLEGLKIEKVLVDWTTSECTALLARPIFDPETYGFVRFHHRDTLELLTAKWVNKLLKSGNSRRKVEGLFFTNQYGIEVVMPKLRPVLPWLALFDQNILDRLIENWPEVLFEGGDPSKLPLASRETLMKNVCEQFAAKKTARISVDINVLQRLVDKDMAKVVLELFSEYSDVQEIRRFLLRSVEQGPIPECLEIAKSFALDDKIDDYSRTVAMRAMMVIGSKATLKKHVTKILSDPWLKRRSNLSNFIAIFGLNFLSPSEIIGLISEADQPHPHRYQGLNNTLSDYLKICPIGNVVQILEGTSELLRKAPYRKERHFDVSDKYNWLLECVAVACERLIAEKHPAALTETTIMMISLIGKSDSYTRPRNEHKLRELIPNWPELNLSLFWHDVSVRRKSLLEKEEEQLTDFWQVGIYGALWKFSSAEFDTVLQCLTTKPLLDDQLVVVSLAFAIYRDASRPAAWRSKLKKVVQGTVELEEKLNNFLNPPTLTESEKRYRKSEAGYKRRRKQREEKETKYNVDWKSALPNRLEEINGTKNAGAGKVWNSQVYLFERMGELGKGHSTWSHSNWQDLVSDQSLEVAEAMRDGLKKSWRSNGVGLKPEIGTGNNGLDQKDIFALSGLEIEAKETLDWPNNLSFDDAKLASRYLLKELNGFPNWFRAFNKRFPKIVKEMILKEITWDMFENPAEDRAHYVLSDITWHATWLFDTIAQSVFALVSGREPKHKNNLSNAISIILSSNNVSDIEFSELAASKTKGQIPSKHIPIWFAAWMSVDPDSALKPLMSLLEALPDKEATKTAVSFINCLMGSRSERGLSGRENHKSPKILKDIYLLMHKYIRPEEDIDRSNNGVYSPNSRDDAQDARSSLFSQLTEIPGKEAFESLMEISREHKKTGNDVWMRNHAINRAELDAEGAPWNLGEFRDFAENLERTPKTHRQLFDLTVFRLEDLKTEWEDGDTSIAGVVIKTKEETELRNFIANVLKQQSNSRYMVGQEEEKPDAKRTDIRLHGAAGIDGPVPIELKIADNGWSGSKLYERLENQLCGDYLRDQHSNCGVFLLVSRGTQKHWVHPSTGNNLSFEELVDALQKKAAKLIEELSGIENIRVIGIDLTKRGAGTKKAKSKKIG